MARPAPRTGQVKRPQARGGERRHDGPAERSREPGGGQVAEEGVPQGSNRAAFLFVAQVRGVRRMRDDELAEPRHQGGDQQPRPRHGDPQVDERAAHAAGQQRARRRREEGGRPAEASASR